MSLNIIILILGFINNTRMSWYDGAIPFLRNVTSGHVWRWSKHHLHLALPGAKKLDLETVAIVRSYMYS